MYYIILSSVNIKQFYDICKAKVTMNADNSLRVEKMFKNKEITGINVIVYFNGVTFINTFLNAHG